MEKREFPRFDKELDAAYSTGNAKALRGKILNISLGGVYMLTEDPIRTQMPVSLTFTVKQNGDASSINAEGMVLRSGYMAEEPAMAAKYNIKSPAETSFAVIRFVKPVIELSFMLQ